MKKLFINKLKLAWVVAAALVLCATALGISAIRAESKTPVASVREQWPLEADRPNVKKGFTGALNRSTRDKDYRGLLLDFTKPDVVRAKVQEELRKVPGCENMTIPSEITLIFYEPQTKPVRVTQSSMPRAMQDFLEKWENRNLHVFYLPDFNVNDTTDHPYDLHIMCCYRPW